MPRPKKPGAPEPKTRSRNGCWPCKNRKIKCGEERPKCVNCEKQGDTCDYSIRLNWFRSDAIQGSTSAARPPLSTHSSSEVEYSRQQGIGTSGITRLGGGSSLSPPLQTPPRPSSLPLKRPNEGQIRHHSAGSQPPTTWKARTPEHVGFLTAKDSFVPRIATIVPALAGTSGLPAPIPLTPGSGAGPSGNVDMQKTVTGFRDHMSASQLSRLGDSRAAAYPSPADSNVESPPCFGPSNSAQGFSYHNPMPPPIQGPTSASPFPPPSRRYPDDESEHRSKRMRFSTFDTNDNFSRSHGLFNGPGPADEHKIPPAFSPYLFDSGLNNSARYSGSVLVPPPTAMEDINPTIMPARPASAQTDNDIRRLSVKSLLSDGSEQPDSGGESVPPPPPLDPYVHYGIDRGFPDLDLPKNNDATVLNGFTPALSTPGLCRGESVGKTDDIATPVEFGFGLFNADAAHSEGGYYAKSVTVSIPRSLGTLPSTLSDNPMNLLYFHHFLNHTARILVPHDCIENPFRSVLPQMALRDSNLLHLLLAYSASHRARLLKQPEPANRIALWVQEIFPSLSRALNDSSAQVSNANLATAIMLASLEIISPNTFEVPIPWQSHLNVARRMLMSRGGAKSIHRKDVISYFLSRWFAYLDVLGSLSGGKNDQPLFGGDYWASDDSDLHDDFQTDCLIGFTSHCVGILAKIAELARQCDSQRVDADGTIIENWTPPAHILSVARTLKADLQDARLHTYRGCPHKHGNDVEDAWDTIEMAATNEAFHWAGLIHLDRRVFGKPSNDTEIQLAVGKIVESLEKVRKGSTAEACLLFPMFTAGCHAFGEGRRWRILERLRSVEGSGMTQVHKARTLIERVWETGKPWETLAAGEFFG